jgi:DNA repair exonuclease SbcCD ATPase subunit
VSDKVAGPDGSALSEGLGAGAEACPTCGSDCNERDELIKAEREIERLREELRIEKADAQERTARKEA